MTQSTLVFVHSSSELYGSDKSLRAVVAHATERHYRVVVVLPEPGPLVGELEQHGAEVRILPIAVLRRSIVTASGLVQFLRGLVATRRSYGWLADYAQSGPMVITSNTSAVASGAILARRARVPHVMIVREFYRAGLELSVFRAFVGTADRVICVSRAVASQFRTISDIQVIYSGADLAHGDIQPPREIAPSGERQVVILCPGRLNGWKGQDVLISALSLLSARGITVSTRIVGGEYGGSTSYTRELQYQIDERGLTENVVLVGELANLDEEYLTADIVVVPSKRAEPFGKVVIEAMNHGCPVIASNLGGPAEVISEGENGMLVRPGDAGDLADAIERLVVNKALRTQIASNAFTRSLDFDVRESAARVVDVLQGQLTSRQAASKVRR